MAVTDRDLESRDATKEPRFTIPVSWGVAQAPETYHLAERTLFDDM